MTPPALDDRRRRDDLPGMRPLLALLLLALVLASPAAAAPRAELWERWTAHDPASAAAVDHSAWDRFLARYLRLPPDGRGATRVAYGEVTPDDRRELERYVEGLAATRVSALARDEQFAFWANLYNALTVRVVLDRYPVRSIRDIDISPGWFADGPWGAKLVRVEGEELSLDDVEHRILRPIWRDPRVHYAVNCAAVGCPSLRPRAFRAATLDADLDEAARAFVNDPRGVRVEGGRVVASRIYAWFREDWGTDAAVLDHLRAHAAPALRAELEGRTTIDGHAYDWSLNDAAPGG